MDLKINPLFRDKIPPLTTEEFEQLRKNILEDGVVREPLVVWNGQIVDGHHRWRIIQEHPEIPYTVKEMEFADEWAAIAWMCANQLGRRSVTNAQRMMLIADYYNARKHTESFKGNQYKNCGEDQKGPKQKNYHGTRSIVAEELGVSQKNVLNAVEFSAGVDAAEEVSQGFREKVMSGEIKAPKSRIAEIRNMDDEQKQEVVSELERGEKVHKGDIATQPKKERKSKYSSINEAIAMVKAPPIKRTDESIVEEVKAAIISSVSSIKRSIADNSVIVKKYKDEVLAEFDKGVNELNELRSLIEL